MTAAVAVAIWLGWSLEPGLSGLLTDARGFMRHAICGRGEINAFGG